LEDSKDEDWLYDLTDSYDSDIFEDFTTSGDFTDTVRGGGGGFEVPVGDLGLGDLGEVRGSPAPLG